TLLAVAAAVFFGAATPPALADAGALRARHAELRDELRTNNFGRPLFIESTESSGTLQGDVYAVLDHPFEKVSQGLKEPNAWCDVMILPFNTKYCRAVGKEGGEQLVVRIGRKFNQP